MKKVLEKRSVHGIEVTTNPELSKVPVSKVAQEKIARAKERLAKNPLPEHLLKIAK